ncbi:MAG: tyrosine-type recombinase/integrase [Clostridia bacterium]|nr:tyrosine-type recombinase/integrase [Clostridia bacterium]
MCYFMTAELLKSFTKHLYLEEKSRATIAKYAHDVAVFADYVGEREIDRETVLAYKSMLAERYAISSANSMIAALNAFFQFCDWQNLMIKQFRVQREVFCAEEKELTKTEYVRLLQAAEKKKDQRLALILQTICGTGIRVSELSYITVEAVKAGEARVRCKGKMRRIFIVSELRKKLLAYIKQRKLHSGIIFLTKRGKPIDRTAIWRAMKSLCATAHVAETKVFPHNLRHLFARAFYGVGKDIVALADILGHASINTTRIYTMSSGVEYRKKMNCMRLIL